MLTHRECIGGSFNFSTSKRWIYQYNWHSFKNGKWILKINQLLWKLASHEIYSWKHFVHVNGHISYLDTENLARFDYHYSSVQISWQMFKIVCINRQLYNVFLLSMKGNPVSTLWATAYKYIIITTIDTEALGNKCPDNWGATVY